jgi:hypothetical protein
MTSNVKVVCLLGYINCYPEDGLDWPKHAKILISFFLKNMIVNHYANHVLLIFHCMPQHFIHTMYYEPLHYK